MSALESAAPIDLRGSQRPGLLHLPDGTDAFSDDALYLLGEWGFDYDEWQRFAMRCALLEQPDGRWAAKEFGLEIPRQNGKGEEIEGREALGLFYLEERKLIHSAHEFATASEALDRMDDRIAQNPALKHRVKSVKRSHGEEGVYLKDGRKLLYKTRTKGGGRGFSADLLILDEAMFIAEAFLGALMPVISARPNPQMWYTGSAPDQETMEHAIVWSRLRQRALDGKPGRMGYLGWSPAYQDGHLRWETPDDVPDEATTDPEVIALGNPALGIRIDLDHVVDTERPAMDHRTFCVERLGVGDWPKPVRVDPDGIQETDWNACFADSRALDPVELAFDVRPSRSHSAIAAAGLGADGLPHIEIVEHKAGTNWVAERLKELQDRHECGPVLLANRSPAMAQIPQLVQLGVRFRIVEPVETVQGCGAMFDLVKQRELRHRGQSALNAAVRGVVRKPAGEAWAWSRSKSDVDICPLYASTLALWVVEEKRRRANNEPLVAYR